MTLPLALIIIVGEIDLSVASILGISSAMLGYLVAPRLAAVVGLRRRASSLGAVAGAFNGLLITRLGLPSLAVTIGTLTLYRGFAIVILGPHDRSRRSPSGTRTSGSTASRGTFLSWSIVFFLILAVIFGVVLHVTPFGRSLFVMGAEQGGRASTPGSASSGSS